MFFPVPHPDFCSAFSSCVCFRSIDPSIGRSGLICPCSFVAALLVSARRIASRLSAHHVFGINRNEGTFPRGQASNSTDIEFGERMPETIRPRENNLVLGLICSHGKISLHNRSDTTNRKANQRRVTDCPSLPWLCLLVLAPSALRVPV